MAGKAHVQPDGHHSRCGGSFLAQEVDGVAEILEELPPGRDRARELPVVVGEGVRHHEVRPAADLDPVGKLVVVGVGVVEEAALLHQQAAGVDARAVTAVPAFGAAPDGPLERLDGPPDVLALLVLGQPERLDPAPAVAADVDAVLAHRLRRGGVALEGEGAREQGERQLPLVEKPFQAPEPDPRAVLEHRFGGKVPFTSRHRRLRRLGEAGLAHAVAIPDRGLRPFLVVDDEVEGESGAAGPARIGRAGAVADEVAFASGHGVMRQSRLN